jgi:hypothetical protein
MQPASPQPIFWLRVEGLTALLVAAVAYQRLHYSLLLFGVLFLVSDLSIFAYARGPRFGAIVYNAVHNDVVPVLLGFSLLAASKPLAIPLIWIAHIGFDRFLGYGLKYSDAFAHTHLGTMGSRETKELGST